jgi:glycosyltransferase involved in cell wall biosynthesis
MNVLYLTLNPNRQSTTVPTEGWFRLLPERGLRPVLVSRERGDFDAWTKSQGIPTYQNPLPFPDKRRPWKFLKALWQLRTIARRHKIELVHCNEQDIYPIGQYLARTLRIPVVVSVHFTMGHEFCQWAFGGQRMPRRMFFVSKGSQTACAQALTGIVPEQRWRVLYNGLDLRRYCPDELRRNAFREQNDLKNSFAIGVACALRPRKQLEHLFEAGQRIAGDRLRVVVAGGPVAGDEDYANRLLKDAKTRLGRKLVLLGHLDELRDFYNGIDLFVNTSQEEACSISVIESLACGCPVVGYPSKSVDDQIMPDGGEIVRQDCIEELTVAVARRLHNAEMQPAARRSARRQAEMRFDTERLSEQLWHEYEEVLPETRREPTALATAATI